MIVESPLFTLSPEPGQAGCFRAVATCLACKESSGPVFTRELRDSTGEVTLTLDPLPVFRTLGWMLNPAGGAVCSRQCAGIARHKSADFTVDASGKPTDPRINYSGADPKTGKQPPPKRHSAADRALAPIERKVDVHLCAGAGCLERIEHHQTRAVVEPEEEWSPPAGPALAVRGWHTVNGRDYCSKLCTHTSTGSLPPREPVLVNADKSAPKPHGLQARTDARVNPMLVARSGPLPGEKPTSPRGRAH